MSTNTSKLRRIQGYVQLHTTHGDLNIELHCDIAPRACENFITLCERGYYNGVAFHRSIRNFMIQGGDPSGTGQGVESIWGKPFKDEVNSKFLHSGRGVVSMANCGPHTNGSQFFILYKSANHLNFKHTVFGGVVGGMMTLTAMEKVPVDGNDRPMEEIKITGVTVFVNPYTDPNEEEEKEKVKEERAEEQRQCGLLVARPRSRCRHSLGNDGKWSRTEFISGQSWVLVQQSRCFADGIWNGQWRGGVGKYLKNARASAGNGLNTDTEVKRRKMGASRGRGFKDISSW